MKVHTVTMNDACRPEGRTVEFRLPNGCDELIGAGVFIQNPKPHSEYLLLGDWSLVLNNGTKSAIARMNLYDEGTAIDQIGASSGGGTPAPAPVEMDYPREQTQFLFKAAIEANSVQRFIFMPSEQMIDLLTTRTFSTWNAKLILYVSYA